jgi:hypothetical protein
MVWATFFLPFFGWAPYAIEFNSQDHVYGLVDVWASFTPSRRSQRYWG